MSGPAFVTFKEYKGEVIEHSVHFGNDWGLFIDFEDIEDKKCATLIDDINDDEFSDSVYSGDTSLPLDTIDFKICNRSCFTITVSFILTYIIFYII